MNILLAQQYQTELGTAQNSSRTLSTADAKDDQSCTHWTVDSTLGTQLASSRTHSTTMPLITYQMQICSIELDIAVGYCQTAQTPTAQAFYCT